MKPSLAKRASAFVKITDSRYLFFVHFYIIDIEETSIILQV